MAIRPSNGTLPQAKSSNGKAAPPRLISIGAALDDLYACSALPTIATPFTQLNAALGGGLIAGQSVVMPGATGSGKSSLLATIATHVASFAPVLIGTYELPARLFVARIAAQQLDESWLNVMRGRVVRPALERVVPHGIQLMHRPPLDELERGIKTIQDRESQAPLVLLDYLQIMMTVGFSDDPRIATAKTSELVRDLADTTKAPLLLAAAVSRQSNQILRNARRASQPSDLVGVARDVSNIEYDAAAVLALAVSPQVDEQTGVQRAVLAVSKNRFGPVDMIGLEFYGRSGRWFESTIAQQLTEDELADAREQILASVRKAKEPLSKNRIIERGGQKFVNGRRADLLPLIDQMVSDGQLALVRQKYCLPSGQQKLPAQGLS
jgi:replicative DNA helicase